MIVTCPNCSTRYRLDEATLGGAGRRVRCARCGESWWQGPAAPAPGESEPLPPHEPAPPLVAAEEVPAAGRRLDAIALGWAALAVFLVLVVGGVLVGRNELMAAWPDSARLYRVLGMAGERQPQFEIRSAEARWEPGESAAVLVVEGVIANLSAEDRPAPRILVSLRDPGDAELAAVEVAPEQQTLGARGEAAFAARLEGVPQAAEIAFALVDAAASSEPTSLSPR